MVKGPVTVPASAEKNTVTEESDPCSISGNTLENIFDMVDADASSKAPAPSVRPFVAPQGGLFIALLSEVDGTTVRLRNPASGELFKASVAPHLDSAYLSSQVENGQAALVQGTTEKLLVVGLVDVGPRRRHILEADEIELTAKKRLTLKSGSSALRLQSDGSLELLGSRISAASRGVLRLAGRALRLN